LKRARAAILLMLGLPGSAYLYQGEELGLPEVHDLRLDVLDDPVWEKSGHTLKGRDGSRVPIPWTRDGGSFGFGADGSWLPQPVGWGSFSHQAQAGIEGTTLELYRSALRIRRELRSGDESLEWLDLGPDVVGFRRGTGTLVMVNLGEEPVEIPEGEPLLSSGDVADGLLPADTAIWVAVPPNRR
jgi:alpha-glucosidase